MPVSSASISMRNDKRVALFFLGVALVLGGALRAYSLFVLPFAINDGGLFWAMTRAIENANIALPARVAYPTLSPDVPFCYPPLGFYAAALLEKIGVPLAIVFRWLPWAWSVATIWAFWRLARAWWENETNGAWAAGAATLGWALLPWSFVWNVMGGGIARAPGLLFAFVAIEAALRLWRDNETRKWWPLVFFLALALATHLERARFALVAVGLIWLFYGRTPRGAAQLAGAILGAIFLTAPWWGLCLARFGLEPFLAASRSAGSGWQGGVWWQALWASATLGLSGEAILPLFHLVGGIGLLWCAWRRQWLLPLWFVLILLLDVRSARVFVVAPLALGAGILLAQSPRWRVPVMGVLTAWLCLLSVLVQLKMPGLTKDDLAGIAWAKRNTPTNARFLVLSGQQWAMDAPGEWFPALSERVAVLTVQGAEWLPDDEFGQRWKRHDAVRKAQSWRQIETLAARNKLEFDWIWRPDSAPSVEPDVNWKKQWSQGKSAIWRRVEP